MESPYTIHFESAYKRDAGIMHVLNEGALSSGNPYQGLSLDPISFPGPQFWTPIDADTWHRPCN